MALPLNDLVVKRQKERELRIALETIRNAIDSYQLAAKNGRITHPSNNISFYPPNLRILVDGADDAKFIGEKKIFFLRRIPYNPFFQGNINEVSPEQTWAIRSYASGPDNPQSGDDVFDIYVDSNQVGLNGIAYREW